MTKDGSWPIIREGILTSVLAFVDSAHSHDLTPKLRCRRILERPVRPKGPQERSERGGCGGYAIFGILFWVASATDGRWAVVAAVAERRRRRRWQPCGRWCRQCRGGAEVYSFDRYARAVCQCVNFIWVWVGIGVTIPHYRGSVLGYILDAFGYFAIVIMHRGL